MVNSSVISFCNYGWEPNFGTVSATIDKTFGSGSKMTTLNRKNNVQKIFGMGARNAAKLVTLKYEGSGTVEFTMSNPWFLRSFLGGTSTVTGTPDVHTFAEQNTSESYTVFNEIESDTEFVSRLLGCKTVNCVISAAVGDLVTVRLDFIYANESTTTTTTVVAETLEVYTFAYGTWEMPNGSAIANVQNIEITMSQNPEPVWGLGSRIAQNMPIKNTDYSARVTLDFEARTNLIDKLFGQANAGPIATVVAEQATMELTFTNGLTLDDQRDIVLLFTGCQLDEHNLPQDPTALILEDATMHMRSLTATARDNLTEVQ